MRRNTQFNWPRFLLQWGSVVLLVLLLVGWDGGLLAGARPDWWKWAVAGFAGLCVLFANFFCGYVCPAGTLEDLFVRIRYRLGIRPAILTPGTLSDRILRLFKYPVLFACLFALYRDGRIQPGGGWTLPTLIVCAVLLVLGGLIVDRFWCKYFCPVGAVTVLLRLWLPSLAVTGLYLLLRGLSGRDLPWIWCAGALCLLGAVGEWLGAKTWLHLLRVVRDDGACNHCESCIRVCPYTIDLRNTRNCGVIDCTLCAECVNACPKKALAIAPVMRRGIRRGFGRFIPPMLTVAVIVFALGMKRDGRSRARTAQEGPATADAMAPAVDSAGFQPFAREFSIQMEDGMPALRREVLSNYEFWVCEFADPDFETLDVETVLPQLCAYLEAQPGALGVYARRNDKGVPVLDILYCHPLNRDRLWELLSAQTWNYTDPQGVAASVPQAIHFRRQARGYSYRNHKDEFGF
ncbi:MAG: 4Fe-4S binding protein [Bacteroidales bacterium]|nr:4Fe-4S binding protein [Bacteroidales bacterium]